MMGAGEEELPKGVASVGGAVDNRHRIESGAAAGVLRLPELPPSEFILLRTPCHCNT